MPLWRVAPQTQIDRMTGVPELRLSRKPNLNTLILLEQTGFVRSKLFYGISSDVSIFALFRVLTENPKGHMFANFHKLPNFHLTCSPFINKNMDISHLSTIDS